MAAANKLFSDSIFIIFLLFFQCFCCCLCLARNEQAAGECDIRSIDALEPTHIAKGEGGQTEFWDPNDQQFQCAGVAVMRNRIQPRGLLLPTYTNAPLLIYIIQGRGYHGILLTGCPETHQLSQQYEQQESSSRSERLLIDRHQKIGHFKQGDVLAIPAGAAHWAYNDGYDDLVAVILIDTSNDANQLDPNQRTFFIAGNDQPRTQQQKQHGQRRNGNVFMGFDVETLAEVFGIDEATARKLQGEDDERGHIVRVEEGLEVITAPVEQPYGPGNGIEETVCSAKFRENIDDPSRADVYNPRGGRFSTLNSFTLPILSYLQLSVERGVLYENAIFAPHWYTNCHSVIYVTKGESRIQIVDHRGQAVFNGQVREGQIVVVPQNFAVVKQAGEQGFQWVGFNTNDNAMINTLTGRTSAIRGLPVDVIANSYQISQEVARRMKFSRDQTLIFESSRSMSEKVASA